MQEISALNETGVFVIGAYNKPVGKVAVGETVTIETLDAFGNKISSQNDDITQIINLPYVNPLTGPIHIVGA